MTLMTVVTAITLQYASWLHWIDDSYSLYIGPLSLEIQLNVHLIVGFLISILFGFFVYQALINRIEIRKLNNNISQLNTLLENYQETDQQSVIGIDKIHIEEVFTEVSKKIVTENVTCSYPEQLLYVTRFNALGEMALGLAHEINQPLAAISLFSQAGKRLIDCGDYHRVSDVFDKLSQHAQRAGVIIERIQLMTKPHKSVKKPVDCYALIAGVAQLAEDEAKDNNIEIKINIARNSPTVMVDIVQIQQVILSLLRNGMQAMSSIEYCNGNRIFLNAIVNSSNQLEISVVDSGGGILKDIETSLFQPFMTTKKLSIGMDLAVGRAIIEAHNGSIKFYNNENNGATFYFTLPTIERDN